MPSKISLAGALLACWIFTFVSATAQNSQVRHDPIPQASGAFLEKDYRAQERVWAERCLLKPAQKTWEGKAWVADATALVLETFALRESESGVGANLSVLAPRYLKLLEGSGNDSLIAWLGAQALRDQRLNWRDAQPTLDRALHSGATLPAALECHVIQMELAQLDLQGRDRLGAKVRLMNAVIRAIGDGSYDAEAEAVFVRQQIHFLDLCKATTPEPLERWQEQIRKSQWPEWVRLTLEGIGETELAWIKRSGDWPHKIKDDQWRGFEEHLKVARTLLSKAAALRPDRPEPAAAMITVAMGESADLTELRGWFDRSVSAQFDYMPAYHNMLWAYRPRWLGSHPWMLAFGKACAETKRYDTAVPSRLMASCLNVIDEVGDSRGVFRHGMVRSDIIAMSEGYLRAARDAPPQTRYMRLSNAAMCAWLADEDGLAARALKAIDGPLHPVAVTYLNGLLMHEDVMRAEIAADTGFFGEDVRSAANPGKEAKREDVEKAYLKLKDNELSPEALAYVLEGRELLAFEKALATGDWVPLKTRPGLTNYFQTGGDWSVEQDGALVATGADTRWTKILWRIPTKEDVEIRAEVTFEVPEGEIAKSGYGIGPLLRWTPAGMGQNDGAARFMMCHEHSGKEVAHVFNSVATEGSAKVPVKFEPVNHLRAWVINKELSYEVNGHRVVKQVAQEAIGLENERGCVGFAVFNLPWGAKARIRDIAVRKVDAKMIGEPPRRSPPASGTGNKRYWQFGAIAGLLMIAFLVNRFVNTRRAS